MITRNFDHLVAAMYGGIPYNLYKGIMTEEEYMNGAALVKDTSGKIVTPYLSNNTSFMSCGFFGGTNDKYAHANNYGANLVVGSNTNEETYDDYMFTPITELSVSGARSNSYSNKEGLLCVHCSKVFANNTAQDIVINEAAFIYNFTCSPEASSSSNYTGYKILIYRKRFDTPITISANGGLANIVLDIEIPAGANNPNA